jgi:hypothetical protein
VKRYNPYHRGNGKKNKSPKTISAAQDVSADAAYKAGLASTAPSAEFTLDADVAALDTALASDSETAPNQPAKRRADEVHLPDLVKRCGCASQLSHPYTTCDQMVVDDEGGPSSNRLSSSGNTFEQSVNTMKEALVRP